MATELLVRSKLVSHLGFVEGPNNDNPFAVNMGQANHNPWCASYLESCFKDAGMKLGNGSAYTPSLFSSMKAAGEQISRPKPGAIGFLFFPLLNRVAHVVFVESVRSDGSFVTLEGNTDVAGGRTGGRVMRKIRNAHNFSFCMPKYDAPAKSVSRPAESINVSKRPNVTALQKAVHVTPDNVWGDTTDKAFTAVRNATDFAHRQFPFGVKATQVAVGVTADGVWGAKSSAALSRTIHDMQSALSRLGFDPGAPDGVWDQKSENAFLSCRRVAHV